MKFLRPSILITLLVCAVGVLVFYFGSGKKREAAEVQEAFLQGNYEEALTRLSEVSSALSPVKRKLYEGYILREMGERSLSSAVFESALESAIVDENIETLLEIRLNQAIDALESGEIEEFAVQVREASELSMPNACLQYLEGVCCYYRGEYATASHTLAKEAPQSSDLPWLQHIFGHRFGAVWREIRLAHCAIEMGNIIEARDQLESLREAHLGGQEQAEVLFLVGLSYAKQAAEKSIETALPYYQLAGSYLRQMGNPPPSFRKEMDQLCEQWKRATLAYLHRGDFSSTSLMALEMQEWCTPQAIEAVAVALCDALCACIESGEWEHAHSIAQTVDDTLPHGKTRQWLGEVLESHLPAAIEKGSTDQLQHLWTLACRFTYHPTQLAEEAASKSASTILKLAEESETQIEALEGLIFFYKEVAPNSNAQLRLADQLMMIARAGWHLPSNRKRAIALIELAYQLPPESMRSGLHEELAGMLQESFDRAQNNNDIPLVRAIDSLAQEYDIDLLDSQGASELGNQLADAEFFYRSGRFQDALERAAWVHRIAPGNDSARTLLGLCHYQLGSYSEALDSLLESESQEPRVVEARGIALIQTGQSEEGKLELLRLVDQGVLSDHGYRALTLQAVRDGNQDDAIFYLEQIRAPDQESAWLPLLVNAMDDNSTEATRLYDKLPHTLREDPQLSALAAELFRRQGRFSRARGALDYALQGETHPSKLPKLPVPEPNITAARLALEWHENPEEALRWLGEVATPSLEFFRIHGEILQYQNEWELAFNALAQALELASDSEIEAQLWGELAAVAERGELVEDLFWVCSQREISTAFQLCASAERWPEALRACGGKGGIQHELALLQCGQWEEVRQRAESCVKGKGCELQKIAYLRLLTPSKNRYEWVEEYLATLSGEPAEREPALLWEETLLRLARGEAPRALQLVAAFPNDWHRLPSCDLIKATLATTPEECSRWVRKAYSRTPSPSPMTERMAVFLPIDDTLRQELLEGAKTQWQAAPHVRTAALRYARCAIIAQNHAERESAIDVLRQLVESDETCSEAWFLLGLGLSEADQSQEASRALEKAVQQHPALAPAQKQLAFLYRNAGETEKAVSALELAVRASPRDREAWAALGDLYLEQKCMPEATSCWQQLHYLDEEWGW